MGILRLNKKSKYLDCVLWVRRKDRKKAKAKGTFVQQSSKQHYIKHIPNIIQNHGPAKGKLILNYLKAPPLIPPFFFFFFAKINKYRMSMFSIISIQ